MADAPFPYDAAMDKAVQVLRDYIPAHACDEIRFLYALLEVREIFEKTARAEVDRLKAEVVFERDRYRQQLIRSLVLVERRQKLSEALSDLLHHFRNKVFGPDIDALSRARKLKLEAESWKEADQ